MHEKKEPNESLKILEEAIADVGHWRWWTSSDTAFQIEFGWVMLFIPSEDTTAPPSNAIALCFNYPRCIIALQRDTEASPLPEDWFNKLNRDEIEPLSVCHVDFTLTDGEMLRSIYRDATHRDFVCGKAEDLEEIGKDQSFVAFWAGYAGLIVVSESMEVISHRGPIQIDEIPEKCSAWWKYWREYWDRVDGDNPLPKDSLCEITIPAANE